MQEPTNITSKATKAIVGNESRFRMQQIQMAADNKAYAASQASSPAKMNKPVGSSLNTRMLEDKRKSLDQQVKQGTASPLLRKQQ